MALFRVLAKGYTESGLLRETYTFDLLCGSDHAERIARLYLTHMQHQGGTWTIKVTNSETGQVVLRESNRSSDEARQRRTSEYLRDTATNVTTTSSLLFDRSWITTGTTSTPMWTWSNTAINSNTIYYR